VSKVNSSRVAVISLTLLWVLVVPAVAHEGWISVQGRGKAGTHTDHIWTDSCDQAVDGLKTRAWAKPRFSSSPPGPLSWDPDGGEAGSQCAHDDYPAGGWDRHRVCVEQPIGCSSYVLHP
jgi:hypothetical protein